MKSVNTFNFLPEKNWEHLVCDVEILSEWWVVTSHLFKLNEIPILTWDVMCHLTPAPEIQMQKPLPSSAHHHHSPYPPSLSKQQKREIFWQKLLWDHMASLFTLLRTFLCYMTFLFSSKYGAVLALGLLYNIYIFFNFRYQPIPHQKNTPALT